MGEDVSGRNMGAFLGAAHDPRETTHVSSLQAVIQTQPTEPLASAILFAAGLPPGQQGRQPGLLACFARGAGLLPWHREPAAGAGLAEGASRVFEITR